MDFRAESARRRAVGVRDHQFQRQHDDLHVARTAYRQLFTGTAADRTAFAASYPYRIDPVYDDKPFFFEGL